jgi:hypothetical protein
MKVVKKQNLTPVRHTLEWFLNRIEKDVFYREFIIDKWYRRLLKVENKEHAKGLFAFQNNQKKYFYEG